VSGPSEFAELPFKDRYFWNHWLAEHMDRGGDIVDEMESKFDDVG